jgi:predicted transcriptional regulator YheO
MPPSLHPTLEALIPLVHALGATFGRDCEVVLHDVSDLTSSVVAIANGHVTNRQVGSPATDFLVSLLERGTEDKEQTAGVNYRSHTDDGRLLKCTTVLIRDADSAVIGALCINYDLTHLQVATAALEDLSRIEETDESAGTEETFPRDASSFLQIMIDSALSRLSKPPALLTKKDNLEVVRELDENDIFSIKHAVEAVARRLNVSRYTIYNYIDEVRSERHDAARQNGSHAPGAENGHGEPANPSKQNEGGSQ